MSSEAASSTQATAVKKVAKKVQQKKKRTIRLYARGVFLGFRRSMARQRCGTALLRIEGVKDRKSTKFYQGKRVAYIYRVKRKVGESNVRVMWGKVTKPHGNTGAVRAQFRNNLPPAAMGSRVRIMLYPSSI